MERKTVDLGWCIARITQDRLEIVSPADSSDNVHQPASSVLIYGKSNVQLLANALYALFPPVQP